MIVDEYNMGWAMRCLREAKAELSIAKSTPSLASNLALEAARKAREAIYYSLGSPTFIRMAIEDAISSNETIKDPILKFLIEIERAMQDIAYPNNVNEAIITADKIVNIASKIVKLLSGEEE